MELITLSRQVDASIPNAKLANYPFDQEQMAIIKLIVSGKSNKQVADDLGVCGTTLGYKLKHIYKIAGVKGRAELTRKFIGRVS